VTFGESQSGLGAGYGQVPMSPLVIKAPANGGIPFLSLQQIITPPSSSALDDRKRCETITVLALAGMSQSCD
jgi:hypothetical protein